ncbi:MAG: tetratricopeptide repeat protein [Lentisphaeria bacterium]|nr:tetratricopeptide repeat protein [Lentisphaeria bacterium]
MIIRMHTKEPRTGSPDGGTKGADHVFNVFRQVDTPVSDLKRTAIIMQIVLFAGMIGTPSLYFLHWRPDWLPLISAIVTLLVLIALPFVPGVIVRREFRDDVIPACRKLCSEKEIVSGALQCLRFLWGRYLLYLLPLIAIFLVLTVCYCFSLLGSVPIRELGWLMVLSIAVLLLGDCALAVFPVARLFSRRAGMIVMLILMILGQAVLRFNTLVDASGIIWFTDGTPPVKEAITYSIILIVIGIVLFGGGLGYFIHAAYTDAEEQGLPDTEEDDGGTHGNEKLKWIGLGCLILTICSAAFFAGFLGHSHASGDSGFPVDADAESKRAEKFLEKGNTTFEAQKFESAVQYYTRAAELGNAEAQYRLGCCYETGTGVEQDLNKAEFWIRQSADQGMQQALIALRRFVEE